MTIRQIATAQDGVCYVIQRLDSGGADAACDLREDGRFVGNDGFPAMAAARKAADSLCRERLADKSAPPGYFDGYNGLTWRTEVT